MADFISSSLTYTKEDVRDYFLQPLFTQQSVLEIFDVMSNIKTSTKLTKFGASEKVTKARAAGWSPTVGAATSGRTITLANVEAEIEQDAFAFFGTVMGEALRLGTAKNELTGTVLQGIIAQIFNKAIMRDFNRQSWLGDTASGSADYNSYDGIFKQLASLPGAQKLVFPAGAIATDGAIGEFEKVKNAAPNELIEDRSDAVILVSRSVGDNYRESLRSGGTEQAFTNLQNGVSRLTWDGFPIIEMPQWDTHISADALATDEHRVVLTKKSNIVIGSDIGSNAGAEFWYERKDQTNNFRMGYTVGVQYRNDEWSVTDIAV